MNVFNFTLLIYNITPKSTIKTNELVYRFCVYIFFDNYFAFLYNAHNRNKNRVDRKSKLYGNLSELGTVQAQWWITAQEHPRALDRKGN